MISKRPLNKKDDHWFWSDKNRRFTFFFKLEKGSLVCGLG